MTDVVSPETRSKMMSGIQGKDTKPEIRIRTAIHKRGFRYRLHVASLPGKPDLVFPKYRAVIQINGCFWHGHDCHLFKWPSTRPEFWGGKITGNQERDIKNIAELKKLGWKVLIIWECALKGRKKLDFDELIKKIATWLVENTSSSEIRGVTRSS